MSPSYGAAHKGPRGACVAVYDYGIAKKKRFANKSFEFGTEKDGLWIPGVPKGAELSLYHADELESADPEQDVWLCEGEKDADRLRSLGLLATSLPCGALVNGKSWRLEWTRQLRQRKRVSILEDNDSAGREHSEKVARALRDAGLEVRVVRFLDLPEHGDVSDWLDQGHTVEQLIERADQTPQWAPPEWPEPQPLTSVPTVPEFPTELLPEFMRGIVDGVSTETQTPPALAGFVALGALSAALGRKVAVHVRENWVEPVNLYLGLPLDSANLKSPVFKIFQSPLEQWERERAEAMHAEISENRNRRKTLEARLDALRKKAAKAETEVDRRNLDADIKNLARELDSLPDPRAPQLIADDATEEVLGRLLKENDGRIAVMSDEGGIFRNMAGRYSKNGTPHFEMYKHGHSGGTIRVNRMGRDTIIINNPAITVCVLFQPSVLRDLRKTSEFHGEGLLARFLYAIPKTWVGDRNLRSPACPGHLISAYRDRMRLLLDLQPTTDPRGVPAANILELSTDAREELLRFMEELEPRLGPNGDLHHVRDWAGKLRGQVVRIAALFHCAERAGSRDPWREPLVAETMNRALAMVREFFIPNAVAAFEAMVVRKETELAEVILAWIKGNGVFEFNRRELHNRLRRNVESPNDWDAPLSLLVELGWLALAEQERKATGRTATKTYRVCPKLLPEGGAS